MRYDDEHEDWSNHTIVMPTVRLPASWFRNKDHVGQTEEENGTEERKNVEKEE